MRAIILLLSALSFLGSAPAMAQIAPGRSGSSSMQYYGGQVAWQTLTAFGTCFAARQRTDALELVSTKPDSVDEAKAYKRLFRKQNQSCLGLTSELRVDYQMVRGAIAEGLYRKSVPVPPALAVQTPPTVAQVRNFMDAALCYAGAHRDEVRTFLESTKLGSKGEERAAAQIFDRLGECIPPGARSISLSTSMVRVRLAEAMWRLGETPAGKVAA
jgi:hypothetical protein